jgi:hypothetical protein
MIVVDGDIWEEEELKEHNKYYDPNMGIADIIVSGLSNTIHQPLPNA